MKVFAYIQNNLSAEINRIFSNFFLRKLSTLQPPSNGALASKEFRLFSIFDESYRPMFKMCNCRSRNNELNPWALDENFNPVKP